MTVPQILAESARLGLKIEVRAGNLVVSAAGARPAHLIEAIRCRKCEVLTAMKTPADRTGEKSEVSEERLAHQCLELPPQNLPMPVTLTAQLGDQCATMISRVLKQGKPAVGWCMRRANEYFKKFPESSFEQQDGTAAADFLAWQEDQATGSRGE